MDSLFDLLEDDVFTTFNKPLVPLEANNCLNDPSIQINENTFEDFSYASTVTTACSNTMPIDIPKHSSYNTLDGLLPSVPSFTNSSYTDDLAAWFDELAVKSPSAGSFYSHHINSPSTSSLNQYPLMPENLNLAFLSPVCVPSPMTASSPTNSSYRYPSNEPPLDFGSEMGPELLFTQDLELFPTVLPSQPQSEVKKSKKRSKVHQCPFCNHTSNRANNMREHVQIHNPNRPKPFACHICSRAFARKHDMKRHYHSCKKHANTSL
ncbi:unnamed protein product [Rhizopus stolonifer]